MRPHYVNFYMGMVRQLTINALLESISSPELLNHPYNPPLCMDGSILVDALIEVLGDTNKEFLNSAVFCLSQFCDTCDVCIPDRTRVSKREAETEIAFYLLFSSGYNSQSFAISSNPSAISAMARPGSLVSEELMVFSTSSRATPSNCFVTMSSP